MKTIDLESATTPQEVPDMLLQAAEHYYESASELSSAWGDPHAGKPWADIAKELERCAARIIKLIP